MKIFVITITAALLFLGGASKAGSPEPLFHEAVPVDDSGRPLYNSWERYEVERNQKIHQSQQNVPSQVKTTNTQGIQPSVQHNSKPIILNGADSVPSPSSSVIDRPIQVNGTTESQDFTF